MDNPIQVNYPLNTQTSKNLYSLIRTKTIELIESISILSIPDRIEIQSGWMDIDNKVIKIVNNDNSKQGKAVWGTTRSLVNNMVVGVTKGFSKHMEIVGVGYRGSLNGKVLTLNLGLSHTVEMNIPEGIEIKMDGNTKFSISGVDKQKIGQFASVVRSKRPPEPFKGKGVRYADEYVVRKEGKKK